MQQTEKEINYQDIYVEYNLEKIRTRVKNFHVSLEKKKQDKTDEKMRAILKDVYALENKQNDVLKIFDIAKKMTSGKKDLPKKIENTLVLYYYALYNDKVQLLQNLLKSDYEFNNNIYVLDLFVLDRDLSRNFKEDEYISLLKEQNTVFRKFYNSVGNAESKEKEMLFKSFANIITKNPDVAKEKEGDYYDNLLTKENLELFGENYFLNIKPNQKEVIDCLHYFSSDKTRARVKLLLEEFPDYTNKLYLDDIVLETFTNTELASMTEKDSELYQEAKFSKSLWEIRQLKDINKDFVCPNDFIDKKVFDVLDNITILKLTDEAKEKIGKVNLFSQMASAEQKEGFDYNSTVRKIAKKDINRQNIEQYKLVKFLRSKKS